MKVIDAAAADVDGGKIDSYTVGTNGPNYEVTVGKGAKVGTGRGKSEEEAYDNALDDMAGGKKADAAK